jgi:hypothetical protein
MFPVPATGAVYKNVAEFRPDDVKWTPFVSPVALYVAVLVPAAINQALNVPVPTLIEALN